MFINTSQCMPIIDSNDKKKYKIAKKKYEIVLHPMHGAPHPSPLHSFPKWEQWISFIRLFTASYDDINNKTWQELRMLSSVTIDCQITKIVMNSGSQLSVL